MVKLHEYKATVRWTGNKGTGTSGYRNYERSHSVEIENKVTVQCSSDPSFRGDPTKHNPEELLIASISACHMLWYLHLCADEGIIVMEYHDNATGVMQESQSGTGRFSEVTLAPAVKIADPSMIERANSLHRRANELCYIANSLNFEVRHKPATTAQT